MTRCPSSTAARRRPSSGCSGDKCESYGAKKGEPAYAQCRARLDAARTRAVAAIAAAKSTPAPTVIVQPR
jgi:hypothetical protein